MIRQLQDGDQVRDVCVVGAGPVGLALAMELGRLGRNVLLLEAGGMEMGAGADEASRAEIADPARHAPMETAVVRALGGTSWTWGGRCVAYDAVDWTRRSFVADAQWPIGADEIQPHYKRAAEILLCGSDEFSVPFRRTLERGLRLDGVERWARTPRIIAEHRKHLIHSARIEVSLNSTVTALRLTSDGTHVESLCVNTSDGERRVKARQFVLAMGGVETTRLLLHAQAEHPRLSGGIDGPLGRYYMGHISGKIASIVFDHPSEIDDLDFTLDACDAYMRRRFMLTEEAQLDHRLLNTAFWPDNPPMHDPDHGSGILSAVFLALAFPPVGRRLLPEAIRLAHTGPKPYRIAPHVRNALIGAPQAVVNLFGILLDRFARAPKKPGFLVKNAGGGYALHYHAEQAPNAASRITLARSVDRFGMRRAAIDLRFSDQDAESVMLSHKVLDEALQANGIGRLAYWYPEEELRERVWAQAADGFHQAGTTRMGNDPARSVVDRELRVHGVDNLYVASSSVFVTSGQANSTLLAVAFGVRLAHTLATRAVWT